ncbi:MAG: phage terminase large subunit [Clostridia bacterium]|nr:phage terminase large subunit [Clostridia bacterium]
MKAISLGTPNPKQAEFLSDTHKFVAFGGARGGGKSWAVRVKAILLALKFGGIKLLIVRKTLTELRNNHIEPLIRLTNGIASFSESKKELLFNNGSLIHFGYCSCQADLTQYQGSEWDVIFLDEATQLREEWFDELKVTVRGVNDFPKRVYLTCNPGGVGHGWVKRLFIDRIYKEGEEPNDYSFIRSLVTDNKALTNKNPDYVKQLSSLPPKLKKAWLEGDWNIFEGQFFEDFTDAPEHYEDRLYTNVIEPFEVPDGWNIFRSFDWGFSKPFDCSWWAVDYDGRAYLILQLYGSNGVPNEGVKWHAEKVFSEIHRIESEHRWLKNKRIIGVADPSIWSQDGGEPIIAAADRHQVYFQKADNSRIPGWMQVHYRLSFDNEGKPMVYFFNTCKNAIRTLPLLQYSKINPEDLDSSQEDHFADSFRYFCMSRPIKPKESIHYSIPPADPLNLLGQEKYRAYNYV